MKTKPNRALAAVKISLFALVAVAALTFVACEEKPYIDGPGDNSRNIETMPIVQADTNGIEISVDSAILICNALGRDELTVEKYKLHGKIASVRTDLSLIPGKYTNVNFQLADINTGTEIACYYTNSLNNYPFRKNSEVPRAGSIVTVLGPLTNYNGNTPELKNGFIMRIDSLVTE